MTKARGHHSHPHDYFPGKVGGPFEHRCLTCNKPEGSHAQAKDCQCTHPRASGRSRTKDRSAVISMQSAKILAMLRSPGIRFERISSRTARVEWEPSYDSRILAQTGSGTGFHAGDANAIRSVTPAGVSRLKTRTHDRAARRRGVR